MADERCQGLYRVEVHDRRGNASTAVVELRHRRIRIRPPIGKQNRHPDLQLTELHATERGRPQDRDPIDWKPLTDLPITSRVEAIEKLQWYAMRWKIETFHKILKSGCRAEQSKLRTAGRLVNLLAIFCILAWRSFWLSMLHRSTLKAKPTLAFTPLEVLLLQRLDARRSGPSRASPPLQSSLLQLACLGGYLNRGTDGPPGNTVLWRGMTRLADIAIGFDLATEDVGN